MSDLADLFSKDPLKWTAEDRAKAVAAYRELQGRFKSIRAKDGLPKGSRKPKAKPEGQLDLFDGAKERQGR